jgi:hypothetical protein
MDSGWVDEDLGNDIQDSTWLSSNNMQTILVIALLYWSAKSALFAFWIARKLRSDAAL